MGAEYINPQWRLPNYKTGNNQSYSMILESASSQSITSSFTGNIYALSVWFNSDTAITNTSGVQVLICFTSGPQPVEIVFGRYTSSRSYNISVRHGANDWSYYQDASATIATGWHHLCIHWDGSKYEIWLDGSNVQNGTSGTPSLINCTDFTIGAENYNGTLYHTYNGQIGEVAIFDYALPATGSNSVATLYNSGTPFNPMALASPPKAYYPLGNSAHTGSNYLTPNGALQDYVFDFTGYPRHIDVSTSGDLDSDMSELSVSAWINYSASLPSDASIINKRNADNPTSFALHWRRSSDTIDGIRPIFKINNGSGVIQQIGGNTNPGSQKVPITMQSGKWYHVVGTYDGSTQGLYINGVLHDYKSTTGNIPGTSDNAIIGGWTSPIYWIGELSNIMIWTKGLNQTEITTLYNYGSPIQTLANIPQNSNLKAWYKLDASEIYNSSSTEWSINDALSPWTSSLSFDGSAGVTTAGITGIATSNSISFWFNNSIAAGGVAPLIASLNYISGALQNFAIRLEATNKLTVVLLKNGNYTFLYSNTVLANNTWHFVTLTTSTSGSNVTNTLYINGAQDVTNTGSNNSNLADLVNGLTIGYWTAPGSATYNFNGSISNVAIYNTALSAPNVLTLYNNGTPQATIYGSPIAHWKLDNTNTGIQDSAGNYNATNSGAVETIGSVSTLNGISSGMSQSNLVQSDLLTTSSYSPYALNFDGNGYIGLSSGISTNSSSLSIWFKTTTTLAYKGLFGLNSPFSFDYYISLLETGSNRIKFYDGSNMISLTPVINDGNWHNLVLTYDHSLSSFKAYTDGSETYSGSYSQPSGMVLQYIGSTYAVNRKWVGDLSNASLWNAALTSSQVREIYNEGLPSNLNSHSAYSNLVSWWQLGSNSSFASNWTVLDEKGSTNGISVNMTEDDIVDGVGTSGNGTSTNMGTATNISGSSPNGEGNSLSVNMTTANLTTGVV